MHPTYWLLTIQPSPLSRSLTINTLMNTVNNEVVKILPCLTPDLTVKYRDIAPFQRTATLSLLYQFTINKTSKLAHQPELKTEIVMSA